MTARARRIVFFSSIAWIVGFALLALGLLVDRTRALHSYLFAFSYVATIVLGALLVLAMAHAARARWLVPLRRPTEAIVAALPVLPILFLPILAFLGEIYPWAAPHSTMGPRVREVLHVKGAWLDARFFALRWLVVFGLWIAIGELLRAWSSKQDEQPDDASDLSDRMRTLGGIALPFLLFTTTFAAFDWMMSLEPWWSSNAYGVYVFSGGFMAALAVIAILSGLERRSGSLGDVLTYAHFHALGNLLFAFVIFWAYVGFMQFMLIWIANLPEEIGFYRVRGSGGWGVIAFVLVLGHFLIPFLALLVRALKRDPRPLFAIAL